MNLSSRLSITQVKILIRMHLKQLSYLIVAVSNPLIGNRVGKRGRSFRAFLLNFTCVGEGWACQGVESNTKFSAIDLSENKEWMDYDEKAKQAVAINEIEFKFVKVK